MKILRVRRGFSTNCSGANEYFPPNQELTPPGEDGGDANWSMENAKVVFRWFTFMPDGGLPPVVRGSLASNPVDVSADGGVEVGDAETSEDAEHAPLLDAGDEAVGNSTASIDNDRVNQTAPETPVRGSSSLGLILFVGMLGLLVLFGVKRFGRGLLAKLKKGSDDDADPS